jgi:hypothetical protein
MGGGGPHYMQYVTSSVHRSWKLPESVVDKVGVWQRWGVWCGGVSGLGGWVLGWLVGWAPARVRGLVLHAGYVHQSLHIKRRFLPAHVHLPQPERCTGSSRGCLAVAVPLLSVSDLRQAQPANI